MANALSVHVKESIQGLKVLLKKSLQHHSPKIRMLLAIKNSKVPFSKNELGEMIGVNHNSIQTWRTMYIEGGITALLTHKKVGFRPSVITSTAHKKIEKKLNSPTEAFTSYKELQKWVDTKFLKGIKYTTINSYVKRHFGAKLKVARKSHIDKDPKAEEEFKKNSNK